MDAAKMVLPLRRRIMLADHTRGFPLTSEVEEILARQLPEVDLGPCRPMDPALELALMSLAKGRLLAELDGDLSAEQIDALLARRDRILGLCGGSADPGAAVD